MFRTLPIVAIAALVFGCASTQEEEMVEVVANVNCPMSGNPADPDVFYEHEGTKIYACCGKFLGPIQADPEAAIAEAYPEE